MIDIKALESEQTHPETGHTFIVDYKKSLTDRGEDPSVVDAILELNKNRKALAQKAEESKARQNKVSGEIAQKKKNKEDASELLKSMQVLGGEVKAMYKDLEEVEVKLKDALSRVPNKSHHSVPAGKSEEDNKEILVHGEKPNFSFKPKDHIELGEAKDILDFERAGKVTGARFTYLKGKAARLERALMQFMMDVHSEEHGYTEIIPPFMVNSQSMYGTGQFPKFKEDVFHLEGTDYYLIPTSEVSVTNIFAKEILSADQVPTSYVAFSPCFRSEAGSYGRDTKGLIRQHQFDKVELLKFVKPEDSYQALEDLTSHAEKILQKLGLHYRKMLLCSGDISFGAAKCYDLEVWLPGQDSFREISSCSNFEDFQARRANIRYREGKDKPKFVHTLNGSGLAIGRTLIAILENYQNEDGSITVPEALRTYMGCESF